MAREKDGGIRPDGRDGLGRAFRSSAAILLATLLWLPAAAHAQNEGAEAKVATVSFSGSKRFDSAEAQLQQAIGLTAGTLVNRADIQAAADRLSGLGWFTDVHYKFETNAKGVNIQFTMRDAPCHPVWFDNLPWFTDEEFAAAIRAAGLPYDGTAPEAGTALDGYREAIAGLLKSKHIAGVVEGELVQAPESERMIERFRVTGNPVWVSSLEFSDPVVRDDATLKTDLDTIVGKPYSRYNLALFLIEHVRPAYVSRGYLHIRFAEPVAQFIGDPDKPLSDHIDIRVQVVPGIQYHWGGATWNGALALDPATLNSLLGLSSGDPASGLTLQAGWDRIAAEYAKRGYLDAKITPVAQFDDAEGRVSYSVEIAEGVQYRMGQLVLTGLSLTAERDLLANWKIAPGDIFDKSYYESFLNGGARKIFEGTPVRFETIGHFLRQDPKAKTVDVLLDFH
ncbi:MAG TPA: POTRA domain-containing protein [Candidatus Acidoferrales bacterium]|nr:POTRA domain-containing protein [Candidatus Acidoferrales bacterium]